MPMLPEAVRCATISRQLHVGQGRLRSGGSPLFIGLVISHSGGMQEWVIQIPSIPILVFVLFPSLHLVTSVL